MTVFFTMATTRLQERHIQFLLLGKQNIKRAKFILIVSLVHLATLSMLTETGFRGMGDD